MIGIDVLTQQGDFAHAAFYQFARFGQHAGRGARDFGPAGIGHHAEGAEFVAAFLHRQKRRRRTRRFAAAFQLFEFILFGEIRIKRGFARAHARLHRGKAVIGLRPHDQIDGRLTAHDLGPFGLRHAACDANLQIGVQFLKRLQAAQFGIDFFCCLFTDVTGVQQDHIGVSCGLCLDVVIAQRLGHTFTVVDIHLAAVGLDEQLFWRGHGRVR